MESASDFWGEGESDAVTSNVSLGHGIGVSASEGMTMLPTFPGGPLIPAMLPASLHTTAGTSAFDATSEGEGRSAGHSRSAGGSASYGEAESTADMCATTHAETVGSADGLGLALQQGTSDTTSTSQAHSDSHGVTESAGASAGQSTSITVSPFHELRKRWRVVSREFLTLQDFLVTKLIELKAQAIAHWAI
jgi:hypothetical protein